MNKRAPTPNTQMTMAEAFRAIAASRPEREALICRPLEASGSPKAGGIVRLTYGQLLEGIEALARGLWSLGMRKGDKVAVLMSPGPDFVYAFFAIAQLGAVFVPLSPQVRRRGLSAVLQDAEPVALITSRPVEQQVLNTAGTLRHVLSANKEVGRPNLADLMADAGPSSVRPSSVTYVDDG